MIQGSQKAGDRSLQDVNPFVQNADDLIYEVMYRSVMEVDGIGGNTTALEDGWLTSFRAMQKTRVNCLSDAGIVRDIVSHKTYYHSTRALYEHLGNARRASGRTEEDKDPSMYTQLT